MLSNLLYWYFVGFVLSLFGWGVVIYLDDSDTQVHNSSCFFVLWLSFGSTSWVGFGFLVFSMFMILCGNDFPNS